MTSATGPEKAAEGRLRPPAEVVYARELAALQATDKRSRPPNWRLSPWAVVTYLMGGALDDGTAITAKYIGDRRLMEVAVATLSTDRALLLLGVPGTAKSWVSEHLAAAICGNSRLVVQGTAGTSEEAIRYGWNYAQLLAHGPSRAAVVASPVMRAMTQGLIARVEELTRIPAETQDGLISILSEKTLAIPELDDEVFAERGFNLIATANNRDRGVNELSSALKRRSTTVVLPPPATIEAEVAIVTTRLAALARTFEIPGEPPGADQIRKVVTIFRELCEGVTHDGKAKVKQPSGTLSTAEAIGVFGEGLALAAHFGSGTLAAADIASGLVGAVVRDPGQDGIVWREYLETVVKERPDYRDLYQAARERS